MLSDQRCTENGGEDQGKKKEPKPIEYMKVADIVDLNQSCAQDLTRVNMDCMTEDEQAYFEVLYAKHGDNVEDGA